MDLKEYENRKVRIVLKNNFTYVGKILSHGETFVKIRDKYERIVFIRIEEINVLEDLE